MLVTKEQVNSWKGHNFDGRYTMRTVYDYLKAHPMSTSEEIYHGLTPVPTVDLEEMKLKKQHVRSTISKLRDKG